MMTCNMIYIWPTTISGNRATMSSTPSIPTAPPFSSAFSTLHRGLGGRIGVAGLGLAAVLLLVGLGGGGLEGLLEVGNDVVDVLGADGDSDEVL